MAANWWSYCRNCDMLHRMKIVRNCDGCGIAYQAETKYLKRHQGQFCGRACSTKYQRRPHAEHAPNLICEKCGTPFYKRPAHFANSKSGHRFCSRACKDQAQRIGGIAGIQPPHYGTETSKSYRDIAFRALDRRCIGCGYDTHPDVLEVHHRDRNRSNNATANLAVLCPTCHTEVHRGLRKLVEA